MPSPPKKKVRRKNEGHSNSSLKQATPVSFPIVAIGASAGGLEAFSDLLRALPAKPGIALVFIPHLDPTHESAMVELLSRTTPLPVMQAAEGMRVACNSVYVLPPNSDMTIEGAVLRLLRREAGRGLHMPIDRFFCSLAEDQTTNAFGVILSGTGNDGTIGLSAIKHEGGITFTQDLESAKYDGMPNSAVAAGVVDYVLAPDRIAGELIRIQRQPLGERPPRDAFDGQEGLLKEIFRLLRSYSKVDFVDYKTRTIRRRILRRMNINQLSELADYVRLLNRNPQEVEALYRDVLINVTSFFRNPEVFEGLRGIVYPKILAGRTSQEPVRVWVPGCSTGEEAYSHAISLVEVLADLGLDVPIQIFGTDLSESAIQRARAGMYKENIASEVSAMRLRRFFHKVPGGYLISKSIRDMCVFARQNVFGDPPFSRMELISCRNVLIYLSPVLQKKVIPIFHYALKPGGFLLVGNTEGLVGAGTEIFSLVDRRSKIYQKKTVPSPVTFGLTVSAHESGETGRENLTHGGREDEPPRTPAEVQREADRLLLTKYVPSAVVVSDDLEIRQSRGRTNRYLELRTGRASLEIADTRDLQIAQLRQELASTKEYLQSIIEAQEATNEELKSANEEIQSGNEELQSTNEELQTSKEELESANEELNTVNEEIQHRNQQLAQLSNDLINLLNSATVPMIMLGEDLRIRRYTPEAERVFGFSGHDMGKALTHLHLNLEFAQLERWMLDVMRDVTMRNERVQGPDGRSYKLRITPYRTLENKIEGVVVALFDISDLVGAAYRS